MPFQGIRRGLNAIRAVDPNLSTLIQEEKDTIEAMKTLAKEIADSAVYVQKWGQDEHFDLKDMTMHFSEFTVEIERMIVELADGYTNYRSKLKEINKRSEELHELIKKQQSAEEKLKKAKASGKPIEVLEREERDFTKQVQEMEALNEGLKRSCFREGMMIQYQGWADFAIKISQLAHFGKHMAAQIPQGTVGAGESLPPYTGTDTTKQIMDDFKKAMEKLSLQPNNRPLKADSQSSLTPYRRDSLSVESSQSRPSTPNPPGRISNHSPRPLPSAPSSNSITSYTQVPHQATTASIRNSMVQPEPNRTSIPQSTRYSVQYASLYQEPVSSPYASLSNKPSTNDTLSKPSYSSLHDGDLTQCAFCRNYVEIKSLKDHLDSHCQSHITRYEAQKRPG